MYNENCNLFLPSLVSCHSCQTSPSGHLQALSVRAQAEAGLPGALPDGPEEAQEEKPGEALVQVRDQRERGETEAEPTPTFHFSPKHSVHLFNTLFGCSGMAPLHAYALMP